MNLVPGRLRSDTAFGFLDESLNADQLFHPLLVSNCDVVEGKARDVVTMTLGMASPIERSRYEYVVRRRRQGPGRLISLPPEAAPTSDQVDGPLSPY